jgi:hypothetical protein
MVFLHIFFEKLFQNPIYNSGTRSDTIKKISFFKQVRKRDGGESREQIEALSGSAKNLRSTIPSSTTVNRLPETAKGF